MNICIYDCDYDDGKDNTALKIKKILKNEDIDIFRMKENSFPPSIEKYDGFIINGSAKHVNENLEWMKRLKNLLNTKKPVLGICFGHQLLAKILGGEVREMGQRNFGYGELSLTEEGIKHPLFKGIPAMAPVFFSHKWVVTSLPYGSTLLSRNSVGIQGFEKENYIGVQFHPDFSYEIAVYLAKKYNLQLSPLESDLHEKWREVNRRLFSNFIEIVKNC